MNITCFCSYNLCNKIEYINTKELISENIYIYSIFIIALEE